MWEKIRFLSRNRNAGNNEDQQLAKELREIKLLLEENFSKRDRDIDYLYLSKVVDERLYNLTVQYPILRDILKWYPEKAEMLYSFRDDEGAWHSWDYQKMLQHKRGFDESNTWDRYEKASASGNVSLEEIGPLGGGTNWPYEAVAYLSFAYYTKWWYKQVINRIDDWLAESQ